MLIYAGAKPSVSVCQFVLQIAIHAERYGALCGDASFVGVSLGHPVPQARFAVPSGALLTVPRRRAHGLRLGGYGQPDALGQLDLMPACGFLPLVLPLAGRLIGARPRSAWGKDASAYLSQTNLNADGR